MLPKSACNLLCSDYCPTHILRDLATEPAWAETDLGMPLPKTRHACSMCLPTWDSVLGYEKKRAKQTGETLSPRFMETVLVALNDLGFEKKKVHHESYG